MKSLSSFTKVYLSRDPRDFRQWIDGLVAIVEGEMKLSPFESAIFGFANRRLDKVKLLYWDRTGYAIWYKRLEEHRFHWPRRSDDSVVTLTPKELRWLLDGLDITKTRPHATLKYAANF